MSWFLSWYKKGKKKQKGEKKKHLFKRQRGFTERKKKLRRGCFFNC